MCLMAFAWQQGEHFLTLIANRDEFHARPTRAASFWTAEDRPELLAGKDLEAGGTWLGVTRGGRFAAVTNIRAPGAQLGNRSRGRIVFDYLAGTLDPSAYMKTLLPDLPSYSGFNLVAGSPEELFYLNSREAAPRPLAPGIYGLSNASLDDPWPKLKALRDGLADNPSGAPAELLALLRDPRTYPETDLPRTGVSSEWERLLSAAFILGEDYGTRASSFLRLSGAGEVEFVERRFGPMGAALGENSWRWPLSASD